MKKFIYKINTQEFSDKVDDFFLYDYFDKNNITYGEPNDNRSMKDVYINNEINSLGKEGWELVSVIEKKDKTNFYFKKEIE